MGWRVPRFAIRDFGLYVRVMPRKIEIPREAARAFVRDLRAYYVTKDRDRRTQIAARQAEQLSKHLPGKAVVEMAEVRELFRQMRDHLP
jgi:hypothetical protein